LWDQVINHLSEVKNIFPWISFLAGMGGSLHCVGMCGGLVTSTCNQNADIMRYQLGRLLSYLILGLLAGLLGSLLGSTLKSPWFTNLGAVMMGGLFIYWGAKNFLGKKAELPLPKFLSRSYYRLWNKLVKNNSTFSRSFFTGLISIMLPCGLLYGIVLSTVAFQHTYEALFSMFFFWLGTLPAMVVAPGVIRKILTPLKMKLPKVYAMSLVLIGVITISYRVVNFNQLPASSSAEVPSEAVHSCH